MYFLDFVSFKVIQRKIQYKKKLCIYLDMSSFEFHNRAFPIEMLLTIQNVPFLLLSITFNAKAVARLSVKVIQK